MLYTQVVMVASSLAPLPSARNSSPFSALSLLTESFIPLHISFPIQMLSEYSHSLHLSYPMLNYQLPSLPCELFLLMLTAAATTFLDGIGFTSSSVRHTLAAVQSGSITCST